MNATTKKPSTRKSTTPKKPAAKKATPRKATPTKAAATSTSTSKTTTSPVNISPEERWRMIAVAAYHRAEKRGFDPGHEVEDWLQAEKEVSAALHAT